MVAAAMMFIGWERAGSYHPWERFGWVFRDA